MTLNLKIVRNLEIVIHSSHICCSHEGKFSGCRIDNVLDYITVFVGYNFFASVFALTMRTWFHRDNNTTARVPSWSAYGKL